MKTVLITGASGGIGAACADAFAGAGYAVAVHACAHPERAEALVMELRGKYEVPAMAVRADLSRTDDVTAMAALVRGELGFVGTLVNAAGIAQQKLFTDLTDEDWDRMLSVDLGGTFRTCRAFLPEMIRRGEGTIVNVSSMWGQVGASCEVHYSAAKAGVIGLTKALAKEVAPSGVRVNCVAPGVIRTPMLDCFTEDDLAALADETPLGRLGTPAEIAAAVLWLASPAASFVTGQVLGVSGGMVV